jgi:hypothetical protein
MTAFMFVAVPLLVAWVLIALAEILMPGSVIRWRRSFLDRTGRRLPGSQPVARFFDVLTGEEGASQPSTTPAVTSRVRLFGALNLALAALTAVVLTQIGH